MNIQTLHIDKIKPYWRNPRKIDKAVETVKESIKLYGYTVPIIVDKNHVIITGHTRYKALRELGYEDVKVIVRTDLDDDKVKQFRIVDNKSNEVASWDKDLLMFEMREIEEFMNMKLFFDDKEFDSLMNISNELEAELETSSKEFEASVRAELSEESKSAQDNDVEERVEQRLAEERERIRALEEQRFLERQRELEAENERIRKKQEELATTFTRKSEERTSDLIQVTCPHCEEVMMLSKAELLRRDKIFNN